MNALERLLVAQALFSMAAEIVDTKDPESLRSEIDREYRDLYERTGARTFSLFFGGEEVGTYSIRLSKETEEKHDYSFVVEDHVKLAEWFDRHVTDEECRKYCARHLGEFAAERLEDDGEAPDGCKVEATITPAKGREYMGGTLKMDKAKMRDMLQQALSPAYAGMLEDADGTD